jgi:hypothetical protein
MRALILLLLVALLVGFGLRHLPPEWDPRTPLDLTAPPNALTGWKLRWMALRPEACFAAFAHSGLAVSRVPDRPSDTGCEIENALRLPSELRMSPAGPIATCRLAAAWTLLERHGLQAPAREELGSGIAGVRQMGTHACRNVNHAASGRRSQHATANAIDIAAFTTTDGREISLLRHWPGDTAEARFLRRARQAACRYFGAVLSPDYNAAHRDHFHFDMGGWHACR